MKKVLTAILVSLMLLESVPAVFAEKNTSALTLTEKSHLVLDAATGYVDKIDGTVTVGELKTEFSSAISVKSGDAEKTDDKFVATDDIVSAGTDSLRALIYGDVDRTGKINLTDVSGTMKHIARWNPDVNTDAADVDKSGAVNLLDASKLMKFIAGFDDISLGNVRMVFENKPLTNPSDAPIDLFFSSVMNKLGRSVTTHSGEYSYKMQLARRESESCQFFLVTDVNRENLTVEITDFVSEYGDATMKAELFMGYYYDFTVFQTMSPFVYDDNIPDYYPLVQLPNTAPFELTAGRNQQFMINVTSDETTPAGMYRATLTLKDGDGAVLRTAYVYANVWDFTLPEGTSSPSAFGLNRGTIYSVDNRVDVHNPVNVDEVYGEYYEFLLNYNLTPSELPYDVLDPRADAYMNDPRVTTFRTFPEMATFALTDYFGDGDLRENIYDPEEMGKKLVAYMDKINANPLWAEKSYFTILDEPSGLDIYNRIHNVDVWMRDVLDDPDGSEYNLMLCLASDGFYDQSKNIDTMQFLIDGDYLDIWCPQSFIFTELGDKYPGARHFYAGRAIYNKYGEAAPRFLAQRERGKSLWWYICCSPEIPYANYFAYYQGVVNRMVLWQQYMFGVEGLLYWDTTYQIDESITKYKYGTNGDGQLLFCGDDYGVRSGAVPSWRLFQVRDSFDDFDYFTIAEEKCGRDAVLEAVNTVTTGILKYTDDYRVMEAARLRIAEMIIE